MSIGFCDKCGEYTNHVTSGHEEEPVRYFACTSCKVQTEIADLEGQEVFHSDCGKEMLEISRKLPYGAHPFTSRWHIKRQEKSMKFEVGDKVNVSAVIGNVFINDMVRIQVPGASVRIQTIDIPADRVTLVERPDKFKKGRTYKWDNLTFIYLGNGRWYDEKRNIINEKEGRSALFANVLNNLILVEES